MRKRLKMGGYKLPKTFKQGVLCLEPLQSLTHYPLKVRNARVISIARTTPSNEPPRVTSITRALCAEIHTANVCLRSFAQM